MDDASPGLIAAFGFNLAPALFRPSRPRSPRLRAGPRAERYALGEKRGREGGEAGLQASESLPLTAPSFRQDGDDECRSQELRPGWINPYLVN